MLTIYLTLDKDLNPDRIVQIAKKIQNLGKQVLDDVFNSLFFPIKLRFDLSFCSSG
jgi:hypothetical protein